MRKEVLLAQVERVMTEFGCPQRKIRKKLEELELHHDFLKRTAIKEHLTEEGAEARASTQLGNPVFIGEEAAEAVRQGSWWGRHPILGFIVLPLLTLLPALIVSILLMFGLSLLEMTQAQWNDYFSGFNNGKTSFAEFQRLIKLLFNVHFLVLTLLAIPFNWLARRSGLGLSWALAPCLIYAAQGMFLQVHITQRHSPLQYFFLSPNIWGGIGPILIAVAGWYRQRQRVNRLEPLPEHLDSQRTRRGIMEMLNRPLGEARETPARAARVAPDRMNWFKKAVRTPTYWVVVFGPIFLVLLIMTIGAVAKWVRGPRVNAVQRANNNQANVPSDVWPGERDSTIAEVKARQAEKVTHNETVINLTPYVNVQLADSVDGGKKGLKDNNLLELPSGTHIFGGVPFDVEGRIQLMGRGLEKWNLVFPVSAKDIKIGRKCAKIHVFHGVCMAGWAQQTIAKLVLHYADNSEETIDINSGEHLLDWWGPIYTTNALNNRRYTTSPNTELAWVGANPWIKKFQPNYNLRLYKTTFTNPHPDRELVTVEYVSTMKQAAPFMLGLTVE